MEDKNALSYRHAIAAFKAYPRKLQSAAEARKITGIGKKISELVRIYLETGTIPDAEKLLGDEKFRTRSLFCKVFGVGPSTASIWWDRGYRTLQEILDQAKLVKAVRLGIELLPDLEQPMSRQDAQELITIIEKEIVHVDPEAFATAVGGYRRGKEENGDLDIVISSHHLEHSSDMLLRKVVDHLTAKGYIKHCLLVSDKANRNHGNQYTTGGADMEKLDTCFVAFLQPSKQILRQVDFIVSSLDEYPSAVLGWTGSKQFERALKDYAKKENNIAVRSHGIFKEDTKERIHIASEEQAFEVIGLPWIDPTMRNC
ncbi:hypothetical protein BJV82DRAFT_585360 [Fennellomyces sp. T-0311]|nr:hypothetical protein BJV82DRAFT_585360 [Fennellomyces sp. T-0311]